jgi:hypothetical protein
MKDFTKNWTLNPTEEFSTKITQELKIMKENSHIDKNTFDYLKPDKPEVGRFYLLPKIHKVNNPGRLIVSANGPIRLLAYEGAIFVPIAVPLICKKCSPLNVKLLCFSTNVSNWTRHSVGGSLTAVWSQASRHASIPSLCGMLVYNFTFNGEHFLQINGTAMGTKMAPSYANNFMGKLEKLIIQSAPHKPLSWFRFIDDVDMKWTESEENLNRFFDHGNNVHPTIKFTHETSRNNISFLDTYTTCENGIMSTDIYNKPTDKHQYPLFFR